MRAAAFVRLRCARVYLLIKIRVVRALLDEYIIHIVVLHRCIPLGASLDTTRAKDAQKSERTCTYAVRGRRGENLRITHVRGCSLHTGTAYPISFANETRVLYVTVSFWR